MSHVTRLPKEIVLEITKLLGLKDALTFLRVRIPFTEYAAPN